MQKLSLWWRQRSASRSFSVRKLALRLRGQCLSLQPAIAHDRSRTAPKILLTPRSHIEGTRNPLVHNATQEIHRKFTAFWVFLPTGTSSYPEHIAWKGSNTMGNYLVCDTESNQHLVIGANAYAPEGPLTTFYLTRKSSGIIDSWSNRIASFRTACILSIQQVSDREAIHGTYTPSNANVVSASETAPSPAYTPGSRRSCLSSPMAAPIASGNALIA